MRLRELRQVLSDVLEDDGLQCVIGKQCFHITITEQ